MLKLLLFSLLSLWSVFPSTIAFAESPQDFIVLGVIASNTAQSGVALIKNKQSGRVFALREGSVVATQLTLTKVERRHVIMQFNDKKYRLTVGDENAVAETDTRSSSEPAFASNALTSKQGIELKEGTLRVNSSLKNMLVEKKLGEILMQAATEPYVENGRFVGFKLWDIEKGSIFEVAGFRDGDLVTHINAQPINSAAAAIRILQQIRNATETQIEFVRGGKAQTLQIMVQ